MSERSVFFRLPFMNGGEYNRASNTSLSHLKKKRLCRALSCGVSGVAACAIDERFAVSMQ